MSHDFYLIFRDAIITIFQIWCFTLLAINEKGKENKNFKNFFILSISTVLVILSYFSTPILVKLTITVLLVVMLGQFVYQCSKIKLFLYGIIMVVTTYCSEMLVIQTWNLFNEPVYSQNMVYDDFVIEVIIMANAVYFIIMCLLGKILKKSNRKVRVKESYSLIILSVPFLLVLAGLHASLPKVQESGIRGWFLICAIGVFIAFVFTVLYVQRYLEILDRSKEEEQAISELKIKNEYYLQKLQEEERVKEIYHDLKNYFLLSEDDKISEEIRKKLKMYERFYETGNDFLNIVLAEKIRKAYEMGIQIECHVDFTKGSFMTPLDISTIFGNLLDNALEEMEKVPKKERYIFLNVGVKRSFLILRIKNSMSELKKGKLETTKWNQSYHGYGLKNVQRCVKNYGGEIKVNITGKEFLVNAVIPLQR